MEQQRFTAHALADRNMPKEGRIGITGDAGPQALNWNRFLGRGKSGALDEGERDYFTERAEAEIALARQAPHPDAARAHSLLAGYYLDLVHCSAKVVKARN